MTDKVAASIIAANRKDKTMVFFMAENFQVNKDKYLPIFQPPAMG